MNENENSSLKIENIVAAGSIANSIDLELISNSINNCTYSKKKFPGAVYRMQNPKSAALIFSSGKMVLTGCYEPEDIAVALQNLLNDLKNSEIICLDNPQVEVKNIVCSYNLGNPCNLTRIMIALLDHERIQYEPEVFPGLVWRISDPKIVFLLFASGKVIITGGTNMNDVKRGVDILKEKLGLLTR